MLHIGAHTRAHHSRKNASSSLLADTPSFSSTDRKFDFAATPRAGGRLCRGVGGLGGRGTEVRHFYAPRTLGGPLSTRPNPLTANSHIIRALCHRFRQRQLPNGVEGGLFSGLPSRLGLVDFLSAGEFQEVGIDFVGQPRIGIIVMAEARVWAIGLVAWVRRGGCWHGLTAEPGIRNSEPGGNRTAEPVTRNPALGTVGQRKSGVWNQDIPNPGSLFRLFLAHRCFVWAILSPAEMSGLRLSLRGCQREGKGLGTGPSPSRCIPIPMYIGIGTGSALGPACRQP